MNYFDSGWAQRKRKVIVWRTVMAVRWRKVCKTVAECGLIGIFLAIAAPGSVQADVVGSIRFASGLVTADVTGQPLRQLTKGDDIESSARIDTAANSRVQMRFTDGGLVSLMPESTFSVEEYRYEQGAEEDGALVFGMLRGGLRTMTGAIGKMRHENYQLNTPVATLGIRGTEYTAVLNPPNTLRVHVGRGKVVITNEQGSLEVPAGRNAVVTLGVAPVFSEQEPLYLATAPGGLLLQATGEVIQDAFFGPPLIDLDIIPLVSALSPAAGTGLAPGGNQPPPPSPAVPPVTFVPPVVPPSILVLPDGAGYSVSGIVTDPNGIFTSWDLSNLTAEFDPTSGALLSLVSPIDGSIVAEGVFQIANVTTVGALSWGEFTAGNGLINGSPETLGSTDFLPYIVGMSPVAIPTGRLDFSLEGATAVRSSSGVGLLDRFDLGLELSANTYSLDMQLTSSTQAIYTASVASGTSLGGAQGFQLTVPAGSVMAAGVQCTSCNLNVSGFLAGQNAEQAGVTYQLNGTQQGSFYGAAALKR